jgi:hypothetical protein
MPTFEKIRDKFIELCTVSVHATETRPEKIKGCLDGIAICKRMTSLEELASEIKARTPELDRLRELGDPRDYWAFRCADAQLGWLYAVVEAGMGSKESARALLFYQRILTELENDCPS